MTKLSRGVSACISAMIISAGFASSAHPTTFTYLLDNNTFADANGGALGTKGGRESEAHHAFNGTAFREGDPQISKLGPNLSEWDPQSAMGTRNWLQQSIAPEALFRALEVSPRKFPAVSIPISAICDDTGGNSGNGTRPIKQTGLGGTRNWAANSYGQFNGAIVCTG
jgi:hypothetical protein